jgi:carbon-monoxide dehydrogenase large subunit
VYFDDETGNIRVRGATDDGMSFFEVALAAYTAHDLPPDIEPGLEETAFFDPSNFTFPNSAHLAVVSIDRETGEVILEKYFGVDDVGNVINPLIVDGQLVGGVAQGVGQALWEHGIYGEDGQLLTGSMMDYAMPRADRFPHIETGRIETPSPTNPLGVKGAGEMGTIAATVTVANAVVDALAPLGVDHVEMPFTAERIWQTIQAHS